MAEELYRPFALSVKNLVALSYSLRQPLPLGEFFLWQGYACMMHVRKAYACAQSFNICDLAYLMQATYTRINAHVDMVMAGLLLLILLLSSHDTAVHLTMSAFTTTPMSSPAQKTHS